MESLQFFICEIFAEMFYSDFYSALYGDTLFVSSEGHQPGSQKQTETSVTKVWYGSVNSSLKELINISKTFYYEDCRTASSRKRSVLYYKTKNPFELKIGKNLCF